MIKFSELNTAKSCEGLVPAIIQDDDTRQVLMLGYLNEEAFDKTVAEGRVTFFSRTKRAATICMSRASQRTAMRIRC